MILQALTEYYETLAALGKLERPGWSEANISYAMYINDVGELEQVADIRQVPENGKGKLKPQKMNLPSPPTGRTSLAVKPAFLWGNCKYLLGIDSKGKLEQSIKSFQGSRSFHHKLLDGVDNPAAKALLAFFDHWDPAKAAEHPALQGKWEDVLSSANLVFRYQGRFVQDDPLIRQAWQSHYDAAGGGPEMVCLVTGKMGPVERIHRNVKGNDPSWQPMGNTLVCFNAPAFWSYGWEKGYNAPTSKYAAFAYTAALNYLLADREHVFRIGDTTILFWSKSGQSAYQNFLAAYAWGGAAKYSASDLAEMVKAMFQGKPVLYGETKLDPKMDFYLLGLAPNAARLSVRFFLHNTFGGFLEHVQKHYERLEIVRPSYERFETIPLWKLLDETVNRNSKDKSQVPDLVGETLRAVLSDTRYPATLLNGVALRIRAERELTWGRAAILKAHYLKNPHPDIPKEVLTVSLNPDSSNIPYHLGRLFSVLEAIQSAANPGINATIKDKYFNSASATPSRVFPLLLNLAQKHLRKLDKGLKITFEKQLTELTGKLGEEFPDRMSLPEQGAFQLGYYHQTQARYQKKEETQNV